MKKIMLLLAIFTTTGLFTQITAQCDDEEFLDDCAAQLDDYKFLKAYKVDGEETKKDKVEFSYVFSKETNYKLTVCSGKSDSDLIVNLYDRNRKLIATNYDRRTKKSYSEVGYQCKATGVYYLTYEFKGEEPENCGVSILGFNKL